MLKAFGLDSLLGGSALTFVFQPIFDITGYGLRTFAFEALTRGPSGTNFADASVLFDYLRLKRAAEKADKVCVSASLKEVAALPGAPRIAVNVHATTLEREPGFVAWILREAERNAIEPKRLIVEIVEQAQSFDLRRLRWAVAALREAGICLALDDLGCGYSNHRLIVELRPSLLKLDSFFTHNCHSDPRLQAVLRSLQMLATDLGARVVAEGVETEDELNVVRRSGIALAQGFGLARPFSIGELAPAAPALCYA
jgi:EAL domain-containing protein (putative c-di-GMP-specific phosphodiesterase class I)